MADWVPECKKYEVVSLVVFILHTSYCKFPEYCGSKFWTRRLVEYGVSLNAIIHNPEGNSWIEENGKKFVYLFTSNFASYEE